jgi:two-component system C4-dicarboxylate transport response regulator DctD
LPRGGHQQGRPHKSLSDQQKFTADLYCRIGVAVIELPPLRERHEDVPLLFEHLTLLGSGAQLSDLMAYAWPGNVRELRNVADRFVVGLLGERLTQLRGAAEASDDLRRGLRQQVESFERAVLVEALRKHRGGQSASAAAPRHCASDAV